MCSTPRHTLFPHQAKAVEIGRELLEKNKILLIHGQPRVGKSLIAHTIAPDALVITKKNAIDGWKQYTPNVINYEQIKKYNPADWGDVVIVDESHNLGCRGRATRRVVEVRKFCYHKKVIFLSGTPYIETPLAIYHQLCVTKYSPFDHYTSFYSFFREYGTPSPIHLYGRSMETYTKYKEHLIPVINRYSMKVTYEDAGFKYQNYDRRIDVSPTDAYKKSYKHIQNTGMILDKVLNNIPITLHQYEGGFWEGRKFKNSPKFDWLCDYVRKLGNKRIAIMAYFIAEQAFIEKEFAEFDNVKVFSATKYCEGVDLSDYDVFILYSFGYSGAKFVQLRDRIVNLNKDRRTEVLIPLIKGSIGEQVYASVSRKRNFNLRNFIKV